MSKLKLFSLIGGFLVILVLAFAVIASQPRVDAIDSSDPASVSAPASTPSDEFGGIK